jgi:hypothetical protein
MTHVGILISFAVPLPPVGAGLAPPSARISRSKLCPAPPMFVGARHVYPEPRRAVPVFRFAPTPTVNLTPLYATVTETRGGSSNLDTVRRASASFVGARFSASPSPRLPILPYSINASHPHSEATPTINLTPLNANAYKNTGVSVES